MPPPPSTHFAPAPLADPEAFDAALRRVNEDPLVQAILGAVDGELLVLNAERQVLAVNRTVLERLGLDDPAELIGKMPGDLLDCALLREAPSGCGTGEACASCGALLAIMACHKNRTVSVRECLIRRGADGADAAEYRVRCTPLEVGGHELTAFLLHDVSAEKRRDALERVFLHDLMNTVSGLVGWGELLEEGGEEDREALVKVVALAGRVAEEVRAHQLLQRAEIGDLVVRSQPLRPAPVLTQVAGSFASGHHAGRARLLIEQVGPDHEFYSDPLLLRRVLTNMVKNAIEATEPGGVVRLWHVWREGGPVFLVHNDAVMSRAVRHQVFKRSFSTKGRGRGLGTYGMKLLGERYLGGRVDFSSEPNAGTTFWFELPDRGLADPETT